MTAEKHDRKMRPNESAEEGLRWYPPTEAPFRLAGFAWFEQDRVYRRLPTKSRWPLPEAVDALADCTAGGQIQFQTNSTKLAVRVQLSGPASMNHMPATGQCGFDCYLGPSGQQRYCSTTKYDHTKTTYECILFDLPTSERRNVTLNFPLYQGVREVLVGLVPEAELHPPPPYEDDRPVVVYGTSITQGGCAARPGMAYTNILSRRLERPFINLGFSGSGKGEPEVAHTVAQIQDPACFVLDYEANASSEGLLQKTLEPFIGILRRAHPKTPVLVVSRPRFASESFSEEAAQGRLKLRDFQQRTVDKLRADGDARVWFFDGGELLSEDFDECTVDGSHPTDLGFWQMARALAPVLDRILRA